MVQPIKKVAVLGAGVMGSGIAAHCANAGIPVLLLDMETKWAAGALDKALKQKPAPFFHARNADLIEVGNFNDDLQRINACDWVVEVVKEDLGVKRALFEKVDKARRPGSMITSNTSGLPLAQLIEGRSADFKKSFFVTHFFNPVRYMKLLELVVGPDTDKRLVEEFHRFGEERLGKGIVYAKDTPNFVANRIGTYAMMFAMHEMLRQGLSLEEVDAIVGPPLGRPKSALYRTADIVGLDTLMHVVQNCYENLPNDPQRDVFKAPELLTKMVKEGKLGDKSGGGFYQKTKEGILSLDPKSGEYKPQQKVRIDSLGIARNQDELKDRMRTVVFADDKAGKFAWPTVARTLVYSADRLGEIADDLAAIDNGMKWGFAWQAGPFETWDMLGVAETVERMKKDGITVPAWVTDMLAAGHKTFYKDGSAYDPKKKAYAALPRSPRAMSLSTHKVVKENMGASLRDLGDGILALEFHTKMNAIDGDIIGLMGEAVEEAEKNWRGLVITNDGENFSAGANLLLIYMEAQAKNWDNLKKVVQQLQGAAMRLRYSDIPVVAAPFGLALGGGCEVAMGADAMRANGELYMGLVELGVGVIPAGSGTKELLFRTIERIPEGVEVDHLPYVGKVFETIAMAKVSTSAEEARSLGFLRATDQITINRDHLLYDAKQTALGMANAGYRRPAPRKIKVLGASGFASLKAMVANLVDAGRASPYDGTLATHVAKVLTGGNVAPGAVVTEQQILDLECEAFLSLVAEEKTQARIKHMLETGKPLRN